MSATVSAPIGAPTNTQAAQAGALFAKSEIEASESLELFARAVGDTEPAYDLWNICRISWVNAYVSTKPNAKGNSADQAFKRFKTRLIDTYGITVPRATSDAAEKKAQERAKKAQDLDDRFSQYSDIDLAGMLRKAYEDAAQNPMKKSSVLGDLEKAAKARAKARLVENRGSIKAARERLFKLARECTDPVRIEAAADVLDPDNHVIVD